MPTTRAATKSASRYDAAAEDTYWRENYSGRSYVAEGMDFESDYLPAYRYGLAVSDKYDNKGFDDISTEVESGWSKAKGKSRLGVDQALPAVRDAYERVIRLYEERLKVDKQEVGGGEARLSKKVVTKREEVTVPVEHEEATITRRTVNKVVAGADLHADEIKVPLKAEKVTAGKETVLKEEITVGKRKVTDQKTVGADLKHEELVIEDDGTGKVKRTNGGKAPK